MFKRVMFIGFVLARACFGQHAREYYNEIYKAGGLDHMVARYVCFYDDPDSDNFFLFSESKLLREYMMRNGTFAELSKPLQAQLKKDYLMIRGYVKGVPHPAPEFMDRDRDSYISDPYALSNNVSVRLRMTIVWETQRFKRATEPVSGNLSATALVDATVFGHCEDVAPDVPQHGR